EFSEHAEFDRAARVAREVIEQILAKKAAAPQLYNLNIPTAALAQREPQLRVVPMGLARSVEQYEKRLDPRGRSYFWALGDAVTGSADHETDVSVLRQGYLSLTPLDFDLTKRSILAEMEQWKFNIPNPA